MVKKKKIGIFYIALLRKLYVAADSDGKIYHKHAEFLASRHITKKDIAKLLIWELIRDGYIKRGGKGGGKEFFIDKHPIMDILDSSSKLYKYVGLY